MSGITPPRSIMEDLSAEEKFKLQQAWVHLARMCGAVNLPKTGAVAATPDRTNQLLSQLDGKSRDTFKTSIWSYILAEQPDALVLRFLRARKWDVDAAMDMLISAVNWRDQKNINELIIYRGDGVGLKDETEQSKDDKAFMMQYRSGKSFVRGHDKEGRPIYVIRVKLHDPNAQTSECMEAYTLHNIETIATMATYPTDKACLIFDMTGFGLKNMDFHVVKFLCQVFEARYPETLGVVLIHNAPFVFWGVWRIIKPWLDPVIASKINFTRSDKDLKQFIAADQLQTCYGGTDTWEYKYIEPQPGANDRQAQAEKRAKIQEERNEIGNEFERETIAWCGLDPESAEGKERQEAREKLRGQLLNNYWALDPFIRARTFYHRVGMLDERGNVDFQAAGKEKKAEGS